MVWFSEKEKNTLQLVSSGHDEMKWFDASQLLRQGFHPYLERIIADALL